MSRRRRYDLYSHDLFMVDFWKFLGLFGVDGSWICIDCDEKSWQAKAFGMHIEMR